MAEKARIFNIQKYSLHDGEGIRTIVFFKGCPLTCLWCSNPESQDFKDQIVFNQSDCIGCMTCVSNCPSGALDREMKWDRNRCVYCRKCEENCPTGAIFFSGKLMSVDEVVKKACDDVMFYRISKGGVTLSGGEVLSQSEFACELLKRLKEMGFETAVETAGYAPWEKAAEVFKLADQILYDVKHMSDEKHIEYTGVSNRLILENLEKAAEKYSDKIIVRVPLIGGMNNDVDNIKKTIELTARLNIRQIDFLPYHRFGEAKYEKIGRDYICDAYTPSDEEVNGYKKMAEDAGLKCIIGG